MFAFDGLAGVKHILFLITEDTAMAFQALTTVGESIDGQAGAMHTPRVERKMQRMYKLEGCSRVEKGERQLREVMLLWEA